MGYNIVAWLKKQPIWLQEAASRFQAKGCLSDEDIRIVSQALKDGGSGVAPDLSTFEVLSATTSSLKLISLSDVKGIDKLAPRSPLNFGNGNLAVVYGRNGSGKSGYTRILKKACGKQSEALRQNIYETTTAGQSCSIEFSVGGIPQTQTWDASTPIDQLCHVDIFDGLTSDFYLKQENEATYMPQEMLVFSSLVSACERVSAFLDDEKSKLVSKLPTLPPKFIGTTTSTKYQSLAHNTDVSSMTAFTAMDEKNAQLLRERLDVADPAASAKKQFEIKRQVESIKTSVENRLAITTSEFLTNLHNLFRDAQQKRESANEGAKVLASVSIFDGVGKETWKALWEAARAYSTSLAYPRQAFPQTDEKARCVLCHQELDENAKKRLSSFEDFISGTLEAEARSAEQAFDDERGKLPAVVQEADVRTRFQAAGLVDALQDELWAFINSINVLVQQLQSKNIPEPNAFEVPSVAQVVPKLLELAADAEGKAKQFEQDAQAFDRVKAQKDQLELDARQWVSQQKDAVNAEVELRGRIKQYDEWRGKCGTLSITREAGEASSQLVTNAYITRFNTELQKLGAKNITVELIQSRNVKGKGKYRIRLKNTKVSADIMGVLSDGEKRIVSLAAFLADVTGRDVNVPFVFDDPISSLDQDFEERTIGRLVELSKSRQVIIFTHRLSFLSILTDMADDSLTTVCINCEAWGTGEPSDIPISAKKPERALKKLLDERIPQSRKVQTEQGQEAYGIHAQAISGDFRKLMERIVEIVLLADLVQRHRRAINTMGKIQNLSKIRKGDCDLVDRMMTKYSCYEHSQSTEAPGTLPSPDDLEKDIKEVLAWHEEFSKRKIAEETQS